MIEQIADDIKATVKTTVCGLVDTPILGTLRVGNKPDDIAYENAIKKVFGRLGIEVRSETAEFDNYMAVLEMMNNDPNITGILPFRPAPVPSKILDLIYPQKDMDGVTSVNMGKLVLGDTTAVAPCTAEAILLVVQDIACSQLHRTIDGLNVVILNRSNVIGKPASALLVNGSATVAIMNHYSDDEFLKSADVVVVALPRETPIKDMGLLPDVPIIDVSGCCDPNDSRVIKGIGKITTAILAKHVADEGARQENTILF